MITELKPTQKRALEYLLCGFSNAEIGEEIGIQEGSVKNIFQELLDLSGMDDRVALALWAHEHRHELGIDCPCEHGYGDGALLARG